MNTNSSIIMINNVIKKRRECTTHVFVAQFARVWCAICTCTVCTCTTSGAGAPRRAGSANRGSADWRSAVAPVGLGQD